MEQVRPLVVPGDDEIRVTEDLADLVADEVDDGAEVQLGCQPALDGIDNRQLGIPLLEAGVARGELRGALFNLLLQP